MKLKHLLLALSASSLTLTSVSCQDAGFSGTSRKSKSQPGQQTTTNPNYYDPGTGNNGGGNGFPPTSNIDVPSTPRDPLTIDFGKLGVTWHIGDGAWRASKCKIRLTFKPIVRGEQFNFNFTVQEDQTNMIIKVKHCGVDYPTTNVAQIIGPASNAPTNLPLSQNLLFMSTYDVGPVTLNRGTYKLRIVSNQNASRDNDRDDFIVGNVEIVPNKPVTPGDVTQN